LIYYLDTSAAVAAHTREVATERVQAWLGDAAPGALRVSRWVLTEFSSALSLKVRTGALTLEQRARVLANWTHFVNDEITVMDVTPDAFDLAASYAGRHDLGLRAGDALHLAVASTQGLALVTLDERMAMAAPELGVPVAGIA
jgi:predicted nucleic acid-binding protein